MHRSEPVRAIRRRGAAPRTGTIGTGAQAIAGVTGEAGGGLDRHHRDPSRRAA